MWTKGWSHNQKRYTGIVNVSKFITFTADTKIRDEFSDAKQFTVRLVMLRIWEDAQDRRHGKNKTTPSNEIKQESVFQQIEECSGWVITPTKPNSFCETRNGASEHKYLAKQGNCTTCRSKGKTARVCRTKQIQQINQENVRKTPTKIQTEQNNINDTAKRKKNRGLHQNKIWN